MGAINQKWRQLQYWTRFQGGGGGVDKGYSGFANQIQLKK